MCLDELNTPISRRHCAKNKLSGIQMKIKFYAGSELPVVFFYHVNESVNLK